MLHNSTGKSTWGWRVSASDWAFPEVNFSFAFHLISLLSKTKFYLKMFVFVLGGNWLLFVERDYFIEHMVCCNQKAQEHVNASDFLIF